MNEYISKQSKAKSEEIKEVEVRSLNQKVISFSTYLWYFLTNNLNLKMSRKYVFKLVSECKIRSPIFLT